MNSFSTAKDLMTRAGLPERGTPKCGRGSIGSEHRMATSPISNFEKIVFCGGEGA